MIPDRRSSKRGLYWAVSLLTALAVILSARPLAAAPREDAAASPVAAVTGGFPTRIEGQIKAISGSTWQVDATLVEVTANTVIKDTKGGAEVGAWVLVAGDQYSDRLVAEIIQVMRPARSAAPDLPIHGRAAEQRQRRVASGRHAGHR